MHWRLAMIETVCDLLRVFDSLSPAEQEQVVAEVLPRWGPSGGLSDAALDELAAERFRAYDAEEAANMESLPPRDQHRAFYDGNRRDAKAYSQERAPLDFGISGEGRPSGG
jgi:hypothetical protein